jgi:hypothetical protein
MRRLWQRAIIAIGIVELLVGIGFAAFFLDTGDPLGSNIGQAVAAMIGITLAGSVLPALVLAVRDRLLPLATALILAGPLLWLYEMARA